MLAFTWLGFLGWLGTLLLAMALVVAVVGLILYLWHVSGTGGGVSPGGTPWSALGRH
jgi:hypothetical protein